MKKFVLSIIFIAIAVLAFSEELTGVYGVELGSTKEEVISVMKSKGWKQDVPDADELKFIAGTGAGTFGGKKVSSASFSFYDDKCWEISFMYSNFDYGVSVGDVFAIANACATKFELEPYSLTELDKTNAFFQYYKGKGKNEMKLAVLYSMCFLDFYDKEVMDIKNEAAEKAKNDAINSDL
ncbi:MAG: hypothetical protein Q4F84_05610 [Fibrobacter sp.]|nr:hypothetical protein [Fibrobacter sp.]